MKFQLIDEICMFDWKKSNSMFVPVQSAIAGAQVFRIDNVDHFFWEHCDKYRDNGGFPNYAPPFDNYFMYCDETAMTNEDGRRYRDSFPKYRYGLWFLATPVEDALDDFAIEWFTDGGTNRLILKKQGVKWRVFVVFFASYGKNDIVVPCLYQYLVNEDGTLSDFGWDSRCDARIAEKVARAYRVPVEKAHDSLFELGMGHMATCHLATSLLHCKNVATVDAEPTPKERYVMQEYERKTRQPAAKWKVLSIEPMVRTLRTQGAIERNGLNKALHICRGHFKDFSQGNGLFGKNKGLYWWDQHMRGDESAGLVIKDYNIKPHNTDNE